MSIYAKVAQAVIRLIAFGLIVASFLFYSSDAALFMKDFNGSFADGATASARRVSSRFVLGLKAIPFVAGCCLYLASRRLAERLTRDLD